MNTSEHKYVVRRVMIFNQPIIPYS